jgi:hypothetical protein
VNEAPSFHRRLTITSVLYFSETFSINLFPFISHAQNSGNNKIKIHVGAEMILFYFQGKFRIIKNGVERTTRHKLKGNLSENLLVFSSALDNSSGFVLSVPYGNESMKITADQ